MDVRNISPEVNPFRVVNVITSSLSVRFMEGQLAYLQKKGFDVTVLSSPGMELERVHMREGVQTVDVPMAREISPRRDLHSLWRLLRVISRLRPAITNVATPKAGLLGGIAACVCRIPCRFYALCGLRWETTTGLKRHLLLVAERIACLCAHRVICISESVQQKAIDLGIVDSARTLVIASGNGVDVGKFAPEAERSRCAGQLRRNLNIPQGAP